MTFSHTVLLVKLSYSTLADLGHYHYRNTVAESQNKSSILTQNFFFVFPTPPQILRTLGSTVPKAWRSAACPMSVSMRDWDDLIHLIPTNITVH